MRLLLVTDAWHPQINGVVRTLTKMRDELRTMGHEVVVLGPEGVTAGCPTYPEIRLTLRPSRQIYRALELWSPEAIHIATEGPLGWAMRRICIEHGWPFTTSFHTRFPEYLKSRFRIPRRWTYRVLKHFHRRADCVLVPTPSVAADLATVGLQNTRVWGRGVDTNLFHPDISSLPEQPHLTELHRPIQLYVGRLAVEKNVEAFLKIRSGGTKVVVGDGPQRASLQKAFPDAVFVGAKCGAELTAHYAAADVFVFPSHTDTFGLVMLEALACGTPVAAYPAAAPRDVLSDARVASMNEDLASAMVRCLSLSRKACRDFALRQSWSRCAEIFLSALAPINAYRSRYVDAQGVHVPGEAFQHAGVGSRREIRSTAGLAPLRLWP